LTPLRWLIATVSLLAAIGVAVYVITAHWPAEGAKLGLPFATHLLLLGAVSAELTFRGLKIALAGRACGVTLGPGTAVRATLCGDFLDAIAPARVGAEPARFLVLREAGVPIAGALVVLFLELLLELLSLILIATALFILLPWSRALAAIAGMIGAYGTFVLALAVVGILGARRDRAESVEASGRVTIATSLLRRLRGAARHLREGLVALRSARPGLLVAALGCSVMHVVMRLTILPIIVYSTGATVALTPLVLWPLVLLYGAALAPAPSGGGVMELGFHAAFGATIPAASLGAALIWWRLYSFFIYVALGAVAAGRTAIRALAKEQPHP
jgi:uncharacterized protein (TIRG00374 family)